ncbi:MAG: TlpA disulfide reductase family protein [Acidobacteriota bacterium]|nr:TlpA disulfide reductase family protein [Acidobacteriota bacterium]
MSDPAAGRSSLLIPVVAGVLLSGLAAYAGWTLGSSAAVNVAAGAEAEAEIGYPAILNNFRLPSVSGEEVAAEDFRGDVVVVDFWATWCSPCRVQARILEPIFEEYKSQGVRFLAISLGEDLETVKSYVDDKPYPYPVLYDMPDQIAIEADIYALPTMMVLDTKGEVAYFQSGLSDALSVREAIESARL